MYRYQREEIMRKHPYYQGIPVDRIDRNPEDRKEKYISMLGSASHTYGNALAFMENYIIDLFPKDLFKTIHVNSKIAHRQIRSTPYEYTKKAKPMIIFRPRIADPNEDRFLKGTPMIERQTDLYNTWGYGNLEPFFNDPRSDLDLKYLLNRQVMYVDVILIFATMMQQIDYVHFLRNAVRWEQPIMLPTCLESFLPQEMLKIISDISKVPLYDENKSTRTFLKYMEGNSIYPITYKLQGSSGTREFYRFYPVNIDTRFSDLSWDDGDKIGHVNNQFQISFSVRMEFFATGFYYLFSTHLFDDYKDLPTVFPEDSTVIPIFTDVVLKEDLNLKEGWRLYNSASCIPGKINDSICIDELLNDSIRKVISYYKENGLPYVEFLDIKIRKQGDIQHEGRDYTIDYDTMTVYFHNEDVYYTYKILVCVNIEFINEMIKRVFDLK